MSDQNMLKLASASALKDLVVAKTVSYDDALARCEVVLSRVTIAPSKRRRWEKVRLWIQNEQKVQA